MKPKVELRAPTTDDKIIQMRAERQALLDRAAGHARAAREIAEARDAIASGGRMSKAEYTAFNEHFAKSEDLKAQSDRMREQIAAREQKLVQQIADKELTAQARALADETGGLIGDTWVDPRTGRPQPSGQTFGQKAAATIRRAGGEFGVKALLSGTIDVPNPIYPGIVSDPQAPTTFLGLIGDVRLSGANTFNYLRQTARDHKAAPVADGALKPTSTYTIEEQEDRVRVVAHLSEAVPERYFADYAELERFLTVEMEAGLLAALETQVANGDGTGENMTGILHASGTLAVPFATDVLTTARKALTALRNVGETPTAWVLNPTDDEAFDLEQDNNGGYMLAQGSALWRIPRYTSPQVPAGTAILADWRQATLVVREDVQLAADRSADLFQKNQVQLRCEGRYGFALLRPQAAAVVDLTAA